MPSVAILIAVPTRASTTQGVSPVGKRNFRPGRVPKDLCLFSLTSLFSLFPPLADSPKRYYKIGILFEPRVLIGFFL